MLSIDGVSYDVKATIRREARIESSDISGDMMDGTYFNDVLGTYMAYTIKLTYPLRDQGKYARLYEVLTEPVDGHVFVLPYNGDQITVTARVETVPDEYTETDDRRRRWWRALEFTIIANHPSKTQTLAESIKRGLTPLPDVSEPQIGDAYTYTANGWVLTGQDLGVVDPGGTDDIPDQGGDIELP